MKSLLQRVSSGAISPDDAALLISADGASEDAAGSLDYATLDYDREARRGFPEVVFGAGKTPEQVGEIAARIFNRSGVVLITRTDAEAFAEVTRRVPAAEFNRDARLIWADRRNRPADTDGVTVVAAGTSDLPIAEEAAITATLMGCEVRRINDVGVAGLHRLLRHVDELRNARVLIVVAGMEGALPSVVAGLVAAPVIAVPTSVGFGASFDGLTALLAMLNSCAPGVSVVNIDGGFSAGYQAAVIAGVRRSSSQQAP